MAGEISRHHDPFNPITIIVPNPYMQKWIQLKIAEINGISINVDFHFLNDGLKKILDYCNPNEDKPSELEQKDIQLLVYHAIATVDPKESSVRLITKYLYTDGSIRMDDYDHKIWQLSSRLSRYFMEYELYREDMINSWIKGNLILNSAMESAQQYLYHALFKKDGYRDSINKNWFTLPQYFNVLPIQPPANHYPKLILFGESQLSPFHAKMIFELGKHIAISVYQLNPCSEFWEDITTPREDRWQRIRSIGIEETREGDALKYDDNENPLLKLWGKTGRETLKLLSLIEEAGSREQRCISEWIATDQEESAPTMLGFVQDHILRRRTWNDATAKISQDTSIQVASCPDIFREVESVYNSILCNLECDSTLRMTDIAVMVPDMASYAPVIHSVFSREPRRLAYGMIDSSAASDSLFAKALLSLFEIATGSFTRKEISGLVRNPCFYEAHDMTLDDALLWLAWAEKLNIFREFKKTDDLDPEQNCYTWQQGLLRLRLGRIMDTKQSSIPHGKFLAFKNIVPYSDINTGDQHLIDTISSMIELIYIKTKDLRSIKTSASEWIRLISSLIAECLTIPANKPEENHVYASIIDSLRTLNIFDNLNGLNRTSSLSVTAVKEFIADTLTGISSTQGRYLTSGINISAMVPKRHIPFRMIYMLGMQEGILPGSSDTSTLNLMMIRRRIGDVTRPDINRYHFLETLLAAREKLYITYISKDLQKDQDIYPNSLTGQLVTYLNNHVINTIYKVSDVPSSGSSFEYLRDDPMGSASSDFIHAHINGKFQPVNFNESERLVLLNKFSRAHSLPDAPSKLLSEKLKCKIPDFSLPHTNNHKVSDTETISLNDLKYFLLNPVESALRWHLSMYDDEVEDSAMKENEPFFSVFPYNYAFIINSLNYGLHSNNITDIQSYSNQYYKYGMLMGDTPHNAYAVIDYENLQSNILNRFQSSNSIKDFLQIRRQFAVYHTVTFGAPPVTIMPDIALPPVICPFRFRAKDLSVELKGSLPVLWKNPDTGDCETLVITNSGKSSIVHLIYPFLFYVVSASHYSIPLSNLIGRGSFTIHISHQKGISSYSYYMSETDSREYLQHLLIDFLNTERFDLLPLPIISDKRIISPSDMKDKPSEIEQAEYRQSLISLIDDDAEKMNPVYRPMDLLELIAPEVPGDAYHKVRDRLRAIFTPFTGGDS